jgi:hypothetical protein
VQQHRGGERQREHRHLAAERADHDRRPEAPIGRIGSRSPAGSEKRAATLSSVVAATCSWWLTSFVLLVSRSMERPEWVLWTRCSGERRSALLPLISQRSFGAKRALRELGCCNAVRTHQGAVPPRRERSPTASSPREAMVRMLVVGCAWVAGRFFG